MRNYTFTILFVGGTCEVVTAGCHSDAIILACAERIKKGYHRECYRITNNDTHETLSIELPTPLTVNYYGRKS